MQGMYLNMQLNSQGPCMRFSIQDTVSGTSISIYLAVYTSVAF